VHFFVYFHLIFERTTRVKWSPNTNGVINIHLKIRYFLVIFLISILVFQGGNPNI